MSRAAATLPDPFGTGELCSSCLVMYPTHADAARCARRHPPVIPGDSMRHRPSYIPADARYVPGAGRTYRPRSRWNRALWAALLLLALLCVVLACVLWWPAPAAPSCAGRPSCSSWVVPTTYGPPGPSGGPR